MNGVELVAVAMMAVGRLAIAIATWAVIMGAGLLLHVLANRRHHQRRQHRAMKIEINHEGLLTIEGERENEHSKKRRTTAWGRRLVPRVLALFYQIFNDVIDDEGE